MLREVFELKRDELIGEWRRLHNEKAHDFCYSQNTIRVIKSRRIRLRCTWHSRGEDQFNGGVWSGKRTDLREEDQLAELGVDGRVVIKSRSSGNNTVAMEWIYLSQDMEKCPSYENKAINFSFTSISRLAEELSGSQEELRSMESVIMKCSVGIEVYELGKSDLRVMLGNPCLGT